MAYLPPLNGGRINASITGNTAGAPALISTGNMVLSGGNNVTLSQNGNTIAINASAGGGAGSNTFGASNLGNLSGNTGTINGSNLQLVFAGGNNITLSQSITNSSATISISAPSFVNGNNITFGSATNAAGMSYTASASFNQTIQTASNIAGLVGGTGTSTANASTVTFANANNVTFGLSNNVMTASASSPIASINFSASNTSANLASVVFANSNGVNFGISNGSITASVTGGGAGGVALVAPNNSTASTPSVTFSSGSAYIMNSGALTVSGSSNSINFSVPATSSMTATNMTISTSGATIGLVAPVMFDGAMVGGGNGSTLGSTFTSQNTNGLYLAAGSNITLSQATNTNGITVTINGTSGGGGGGAGGTVSRFQYPDQSPIVPMISSPVNGSLSLLRVFIPSNLVMSAGVIGGSLYSSSSSINSVVTANNSVWMGIYTLNGSTLSQLTASSSNNSYTWNISSTAQMSSITGMRRMIVPFATNTASPTPITLTAGEYWVGMLYNGTANIAAGVPKWTLYGNANFIAPAATLASSTSMYTIQPQFTPIGSNTTGAREALMFQGIYSTTTNAMPTSIAGSQILNASASQVLMAANHVALINATY